MTEMTGGIVVGVDGSAASRAAILFAFEEAALRGVPLLAVCALMDAAGTLGGAGRLEEDFDHVMTAQGKEHPDVTVLRQVAPGSPCAALLTAAAEAQLLVLGAQGRGALASMCLGWARRHSPPGTVTRVSRPARTMPGLCRPRARSPAGMFRQAPRPALACSAPHWTA